MAGAAGLFSVGHLQGASGWEAGSVISSPADATTIVDTGAFAAGKYLFAVVGYTDSTWTYEVRHLNASSGTVAAVRRRPGAGNDDLLFSNKITLAVNERLRVVSIGASTAEVQLSIFWAEVG